MFLNTLTIVAIALAASTTSAAAQSVPSFSNIEQSVPAVLEIAAENGAAASTLPPRVARLGDVSAQEQPSADSAARSAARARASDECTRARLQHDHGVERGAAPRWLTPCAQAEAGVDHAPPDRPPLHDHRKFHKQQ